MCFPTKKKKATVRNFRTIMFLYYLVISVIKRLPVFEPFKNFIVWPFECQVNISSR